MKGIYDRNEKCIIHDLPSNGEILKALEDAKKSALTDAAKLGMHIGEDKINISGLVRGSVKPKLQKKLNEKETSVHFDEFDEMYPESRVVSDDEASQIGALNQETLAENRSPEIDSKFVDVVNKDGSVKTVLKSSVIWALSESKSSLSKDRLTRVQAPSTPKNHKTPRKRQKNIENHNDESIVEKNELTIGDWCLFRNTVYGDDRNNSDFLLGMVSGFIYIKGKCERDKQYSLDSVPISAQNTTNRGIEVLATWKNVDADFMTHSISEKNSFFVDIKKYVTTVKMPPNLLNQDNFKLELTLPEMEKLSFALNNQQ